MGLILNEILQWLAILGLTAWSVVGWKVLGKLLGLVKQDVLEKLAFVRAEMGFLERGIGAALGFITRHIGVDTQVLVDVMTTEMEEAREEARKAREE